MQCCCDATEAAAAQGESQHPAVLVCRCAAVSGATSRFFLRLYGEREIGDVGSLHLSESVKGACDIHFDNSGFDEAASAPDPSWSLLFKSPAALNYFLLQLRRGFKDLYKVRRCLHYSVTRSIHIADRYPAGMICVLVLIAVVRSQLHRNETVSSK